MVTPSTSEIPQDKYYTSLLFWRWRKVSCLVAQTIKRLSAVQETRVWSLGWEDPLEKEMATHCSTLAWKIPWMEEPGRLQSVGSQRVEHSWAASVSVSVCGRRPSTIALFPLAPSFSKFLPFFFFHFSSLNTAYVLLGEYSLWGLNGFFRPLPTF